MSLRTWILAALVGSSPAAVVAPPPTVSAAVESVVPLSSEYRIKAAFLYNFADFTTWPQKAFKSKISPIVVGVLGDDPFGKTLEDTFSGKRIGKRGFELKRWDEVEDVRECHILFIAKSRRQHAERILARLRGRSILFVSESDGFIGRGGIINFYIEKKKVRFEVQVDEVKRADLSISSHLLKVGKIIRD